MANQTVELDKGTAEAIEQLKVVFGVETDADVIRKAIALARIAARNVGSDRTVVLQSPSPGSQNLRINLSE